jgi:AraC-like DNA-binding protein
MSGAARALVLELEAASVDPERYLAEAGLTRADVMDPDHRLEAGRTEALWRAAGQHIGSPLRIAARLPLGAFQVLDFVCAHSETVGAGLRRLAVYFPLVDPRVHVGVEEGSHPALTMRAADGGSLPRVAQEFTLAAVVLRSRAFTGVNWRLERVELSFPAPADTKEHEDVFRAPLIFDAAEPRLVLSRAAFDSPVPTAQTALLPLLDEHARGRLASVQRSSEPVPGLAEAVRHACAEGRPTLPAVARRVRLTPRTLQRRLIDAGTPFSALVDRERERLARAYLRESELAIAEIAFVLGFSDQAAFTRAFTRWTGSTPNAFRRSARD